MIEKINHLIEKYSRQFDRSKKKEAELEAKKDSLSNSGSWSLGYYGGRAMLYEDIVDEMKEILNTISHYAIWKDHKVIGYIDMTNEQRQIINNIPNLGMYIGYDPITRPENYQKGKKMSLMICHVLEDYSEKALESIKKIISGNEDNITNMIRVYKDGQAWYISKYGFFHIIKVSPICFNDSTKYRYAVKDYRVETDGKCTEESMFFGLPGSDKNGFFDLREDAIFAVKKLDGTNRISYN